MMNIFDPGVIKLLMWFSGLKLIDFLICHEIFEI